MTGEGGCSPEQGRTEEEIQEILAKLRAWLESDFAWALRQTDIVQAEVHIRGQSIKPSVAVMRKPMTL
mgnify:FL=1